ncbi:MAG: hypothetical protein HY926_05635 [Elusimicrobia bacterium]|nr:hypothetical protein [Elusimicrobiota bacterium]
MISPVRLSLLSLALLLTASSRAALPEFQVGLPALDWAAFKPASPALAQAPARVPLQSLGEPLYSVPLPSLLNNIRAAPAVIQAGAARVHVFGDKSQNKGTWFLGFAVESGGVAFRNGKKMLRYKAGGILPVKGGSAQVSAGDRQYTVYIQGQLKNRMQSKVVFEPREPGAPRTVFTVQQLSEAAYLAGYPVRLGGTEYRLLYSENFREDAAGEFAELTGDRSIVLLKREGGRFTGLHWFERDIPRDSVLVTAPRAANSDDAYEQGALALGLRLGPAGELLVYYPATPAVAGH